MATQWQIKEGEDKIAWERLDSEVRRLLLTDAALSTRCADQGQFQAVMKPLAVSQQSSGTIQSF
ncbi:hypothetical protein CY34DRAFT_801974 [Suillus luteus UH-Slu-Lm8-n1]|uniref:Uncharacterized protein n=1 Tax=Suillus luteus UH-Slu-Lm8-n1 TaxID=930992 RepID=A0A0D0B5G0_9AGAM|nr:hypothetical protein CY34DRAFT_801974 [Suillus luteus UH-Slu-Lm8-n1]